MYARTRWWARLREWGNSEHDVEGADEEAARFVLDVRDLRRAMGRNESPCYDR